MPKAYVFAQINVTDPEVYEEYRSAAPDTVLEYGGRYLVAGGDPEIVEGEQNPGIRTLICEFPSRENLTNWYNSPEYTEIRKLRLRSANTLVWFMTGVDQ